jgi:hypothetical protein
MDRTALDELYKGLGGGVRGVRKGRFGVRRGSKHNPTYINISGSTNKLLLIQPNIVNVLRVPDWLALSWLTDSM